MPSIDDALIDKRMKLVIVKSSSKAFKAFMFSMFSFNPLSQVIKTFL